MNGGSASGGVEQTPPPQTTGCGQRAVVRLLRECILVETFSVLFWKLFVNVQFHSQSWRFVGLDPLQETVVDDFTSGQINVTLVYPCNIQYRDRSRIIPEGNVPTYETA